MEKGVSLPEIFEIRSQASYSNTDKSRCLSINSQQASVQELSSMIGEIIGAEKLKYVPSKSSHGFPQISSEVKRKKKNHTNSNSIFYKNPVQLPKNIKRILNSSQNYPNLPKLNLSVGGMDTIYGAFFGFLIGDIVGSYVAYVSRGLEDLIPKALLMDGGGTYNLGSAQGTDQTEIMLCLCYGLIEGNGIYSRNKIIQKYLQWYQSKPFNFSAVFALSIRELHMMKRNNKSEFTKQQCSQIFLKSSQKNKNQESSIGLIRILPLVLFGLKFPEKQFNQMIQNELMSICPNKLVIESGLVYARILRSLIFHKDHGLAFYEASKWVYENGSEKLIDLWNVVEQNIEIPSQGNMGKLKTSFTYACIELNQPRLQFVDSLVKILLKGGDTETNCAVVMSIVGGIVGYGGIPNYFKQKVVNAQLKNSQRPRDQKYSPAGIVGIIEKLTSLQNTQFLQET